MVSGSWNAKRTVAAMVAANAHKPVQPQKKAPVPTVAVVTSSELSIMESIGSAVISDASLPAVLVPAAVPVTVCEVKVETAVLPTPVVVGTSYANMAKAK